MRIDRLINKMLQIPAFRFKLFCLGDQNLAIAISAIVMGLFLTNLAHGIVGTGNIYTIVSWSCKLLILIALVFSIRIILERFNSAVMVMIACVLLVPVAQFVFFRNTWSIFFNNYQTFLFTIFPGMVCLAVLKDSKETIRLLTWVSFGVSIINALVLLFWGANAFRTYSMGYSNAMVLPSNMLVYCFWSRCRNVKTKLFAAALFVTNVIGILLYGSRGSLVAVGVFFLFYSFMAIRKKLNLVHKIVIVAGILLCLVFYRQICTLLYNIASSFGYYSRTLYLLTTNFGHDSGRSELWAKIWMDFTSNPFAIRGVNADYLIVGGYSHNFFLELIHSLGIVFGGAFGVYIIVHLVRTIALRQDNFGDLKQLLMFSFFPICLWSSSVWTNMYFWLWLIICLRTVRIDSGVIAAWVKKTKAVMKSIGTNRKRKQHEKVG